MITFAITYCTHIIYISVVACLVFSALLTLSKVSICVSISESTIAIFYCATGRTLVLSVAVIFPNVVSVIVSALANASFGVAVIYHATLVACVLSCAVVFPRFVRASQASTLCARAVYYRCFAAMDMVALAFTNDTDIINVRVSARLISSTLVT